jgi:hypothetical protein
MAARLLQNCDKPDLGGMRRSLCWCIKEPRPGMKHRLFKIGCVLQNKLVPRPQECSEKAKQKGETHKLVAFMDVPREPVPVANA